MCEIAWALGSMDVWPSLAARRVLAATAARVVPALQPRQLVALLVALPKAGVQRRCGGSDGALLRALLAGLHEGMHALKGAEVGSALRAAGDRTSLERCSGCVCMGGRGWW